MARKKPPAKRNATERCITDQLRDFITERDLTDSQLAKLAGVDPGIIGRFMRRERDLSGPTIDRLGEALGLALAERASRGRGRPSREREGPRPVATPPGPSGTGMDYAAGSVGPPDELAGGVDRLIPAGGPGGHHADDET